MKEFFLVKNLLFLFINSILIFKCWGDRELLLLYSVFLNAIVFSVIFFLRKNNGFLLFLEHYISVISLFLIIGSVIIGVYYKEKSNNIGTFIMLATLSDAVFLFYFFYSILH